MCYTFVSGCAFELAFVHEQHLDASSVDATVVVCRDVGEERFLVARRKGG